MRPRSSSRRRRLGWTAASLAGLAGCLELDPEHCANLGGDAACGDAAPYCNACRPEGGCQASPPPAECAVVDPSPVSVQVDAETTALDPTECTEPGECPAGRPFCVEGQCLACDELGGDAYCRERVGPPVCTPWGRCGDCDPNVAPTCDAPGVYCADDYACGGCRAHAQCGDAGCDLATGVCLPDTRVWWVDPTRCPETGGFGRVDDPYCELSSALANIGPGEPGTVHLIGNGITYPDVPRLDGGSVVAIVGQGRPLLQVEQPVQVQGAARLMLEGVDLRPDGLAIACADGGVWLDAVEIRGGDGGVWASACDVVVAGSVLSGMRDDGLRLADRSDLQLLDSVVTGVALADAHATAIAVVDATASLRFSSIVGNGGGDGASLRCDARSSVVVHSSIVAGIDSPSIDCPGLADDHSWLDLGERAPGRGSTNAPLSPEAFVELAAGDAHLSADGAATLAGLGQWTLGDRLHDIDGDPRVGVHLVHTHPGADRP